MDCRVVTQNWNNQKHLLIESMMQLERIWRQQHFQLEQIKLLLQLLRLHPEQVLVKKFVPVEQQLW